MPVKISQKDPTNPQKGTIQLSDVHRLLTDFRNKIKLDCFDTSRTPVQKRFYFDIDFERLSKIVKTISGNKKVIRINMAVTMAGQLNCNQNASIENSLSILVCGVDKDDQPMISDGNLILVEGFLDHSESKIEGDPCCVQGVPFIIG